MNKGDRIIQSVLSLKPNHNTLAVDAHDMENIKFHNELKGENHYTEFEKWREKIKAWYGIESVFSNEYRSWLFRHKDQVLYKK